MKVIGALVLAALTLSACASETEPEAMPTPSTSLPSVAVNQAEAVAGLSELLSTYNQEGKTLIVTAENEWSGTTTWTHYAQGVIEVDENGVRHACQMPGECYRYSEADTWEPSEGNWAAFPTAAAALANLAALPPNPQSEDAWVGSNVQQENGTYEISPSQRGPEFERYSTVSEAGTTINATYTFTDPQTGKSYTNTISISTQDSEPPALGDEQA